MTDYQSKYLASLLDLQSASDTVESLSRSIANARVELNPHQVDAALFAFRSPLSKGVILADEVGLGKTIEAGIVILQKWAERKRNILLILPASLRNQWQQELSDKFFLPSVVLEAKTFNEIKKEGNHNPFFQKNRIVICSYHFASNKAREVAAIKWDMIVVDEAHRLRNVYKTSNKLAKNIREAIGPHPKLLLTATPLQNYLQELYGLVSFIDPHVFGDLKSFRDQFVNTSDDDIRNKLLRDRLKPLCTRTLRKQVLEYVPYTKRISRLCEFTPTDEEHRLYEEVSAYLQRDVLYALPAAQRQLMTLVVRKLLASSTVAIAQTIGRLIKRLEDSLADLEPELAEDFEGLEEMAEEWREDEEQEDDTSDSAMDQSLLKEELAKLKEYLRMAQTIQHNTKGDALLKVLTQAFKMVQDAKAAHKQNDIFYRQEHPLAQAVIQRALDRELPLAKLTFDYALYSAKISALEPFIGKSGFLSVSKLSVKSFETIEFLLVAAATDDGQVIEEELAGKLLLIPAQAEAHMGDVPKDVLKKITTNCRAARQKQIDARNSKFFDEEAAKLDLWSEDLKAGLEFEIKDVDKDIRELKKEAAKITDVKEKLEKQKELRKLEQKRKTMRQRLYEEQDKIDAQRDEMIARVEQQLASKVNMQELFTIRWELSAGNEE